MEILMVTFLLMNLAATIYLISERKRRAAISAETYSPQAPDIEAYRKKSKDYLAQDCEWAAYYVLRNGFMTYPGNTEMFTQYISFVLSKIQATGDLQKRTDYHNEAAGALTTFAENCNLHDFDHVMKYKELIDGIRKDLESEDGVFAISNNDAQLQQLDTLYSQLIQAEEITQIQNILEQAAVAETRINFIILNESQHKRYATLKKQFEQIAARKGEQLTERKYRSYNQQVTQKVKTIFDHFTHHEKEYVKGKRSTTALILENGLNTVNVNYLNGPAVTYFNHIYNYIFNLISNDEKLKITEAMTMAEKDILE